MNSRIAKFYRIAEKLTKEQKKIIYTSGVALFFLFIFWIFIYAPQIRKFALIKKELARAEAKIAEIMDIAQGKDLTQSIKELKARFTEATSKLPAGEETVIYDLSESARKLKIQIKNIVPSGKHLLENKISDYNDIEELLISLNLACDYKVLGEYLNILRNDFPVLLRLNQLDIKGKGEGQTDLDIALQISAYLSKKKN